MGLPVLIHNRPKQNARRAVRRELRRLYGDNCCWCGRPLVFDKSRHSFGTPTIEHLIYRRFGGALDLRFLRLSHYACNIWNELQTKGQPRAHMIVAPGEDFGIKRKNVHA